MSRRPLGPGPGAYGLPPTLGYEQHDPRKTRLPQYSFRAKTRLREKDFGPGPGVYQIAGKTRYGKTQAHEYKIAQLLPTKAISTGPGPAAHDVHLHACLKGTTAPSFKMAWRTNYSLKKEGPAPNMYLPLMKIYKPGIPDYTIGRLNNFKEKCRSPGPAAYGEAKLNLLLRKPPSFTMAARLNFQSKRCGPGPNLYNLSEYKPGSRAPDYKFGLKHSEYAPPMIVDCDN